MDNKVIQSFRVASPSSAAIATLVAVTISALSAHAANVTLAWNRNTETNLAGYRLYYGTASRSYSASLPAGASVTNATVSNLLGGQTYYFAVTASNAAGLASAYSSEVAYSVPISNTAPVAIAQSVTTAEDTARAITLTGTDANGNPLTYAVVTSPTHGTLSGTAPNLTFTPAANYNGPDSFTFRVNDGALNSATATVSINVTAVNDAPVAIAQSVAATANTAKAVTLSGTDVEGSALAYAIVTSPLHGTLGGTAPNLTYTPAASYTGSDSFTFRVNDGAANSTAATVAITVAPGINSLPAPWVTADIGSGALPGNVSAANNSFTVDGAGAIGGLSDNFRYVYQPMNGNGEIRVRLAAAQLSNPDACGGVMIRENLNSGARTAFLGLASDGSLRFQSRLLTSSPTTTDTSACSGPPVWLRLVRSDNTFVAYQSDDGSKWSRLRSYKIVMAANVYVGLAVGSGATDTLGRATFDLSTLVP